MKLGTYFGVLLLAASPLAAGTFFTVFANQSAPIIGGTFLPNRILNITATGTVNILGPDGNFPTNPDGSLVGGNLTALCNPCFTADYASYVNQGSTLYPTTFGGNGVNQFAGGGANYDKDFCASPCPGVHSPWAAEGKHTTDTTDPAAIRLGSIAYTFATNPMNTDWLPVPFVPLGGGNYSATISTGISGGTLEFVFVDTSYWNNTGSFSASVTDVTVVTPEPSTVWLVFSAAASLGLVRISRLHRVR
jgi:hypothetical protein